MTTNRMDFTRPLRDPTLHHNAMWLKDHDVEGERHSGLNGICCNPFFQGKMN